MHAATKPPRLPSRRSSASAAAPSPSNIEVARSPRSRNGEQVSAATTSARFAPAGYKTLSGWSYRTMWWISHNEHGAFTARGIHGQAIYVDPAAEMVIVRFASSPHAGNVNLDPTSLPAYDAVARHLMR